jgi:hypothetical protein
MCRCHTDIEGERGWSFLGLLIVDRWCGRVGFLQGFGGLAWTSNFLRERSRAAYRAAEQAVWGDDAVAASAERCVVDARVAVRALLGGPLEGSSRALP